PSGDLWVAHGTSASGPSNVVSVYSPAGAFLRDVTELTGLNDVWSLAVANGKLYAADHGAGQVLVYNVSGHSVTNGQNPQRVGRPATYGSDDGRSDFWDLRSVAADSAGNIYTAQNTASVGSGAGGGQVEKWSPSGAPVWVKGGYEYQSVAGAYSQGD